MPTPQVELLWWQGCPSTPETLAILLAAMTEVQLDPDAVQVREILTDEQAGTERFPGSPTIRVDGADVQPPDEAEPPGLTCRVYRLRDGRPSPTPDPDDVRAALRAAMEER